MEDTTAQVVESLRVVAKNLADAAKRVEQHAANLEKHGDLSDVSGIVNELLWLTPNLGISTVVSRTIRAIEKR